MPSVPHIRSKINILISSVLLCLIIITGRLYYLQVMNNHIFATLGTKNYQRIEPILSERGSITDIHGNLLATNRPVIDVYWHGTSQRRLTKEQEQDLTHLARILNDNLHESPLHKRIQTTERRGRVTRLAHDITFEQLSQIAEQLPSHKNITISTKLERLYPNGPLASHLVGFLGNIKYDQTGKMGLEKLLEQDLKGEQGTLQKTINSLGKNIDQHELKRAESGINIKTTLDLDMQKIAELVFPGEHAGAFIIMDPKTGAIKALVSRPTFDPNIFLQPIDYNQWQQLQENKVFLNRAFDACYPPASIFKLVTISAALEKNIIEHDDLVYCKGYYEFGGYKHWCIRHSGHGQLSVQEALAESCNILFYHIGKNINIDTLADYARRFGLGSKTNILFSEQIGLIPDRQWKYKTKKERWWQGETLSVAIGQGFLLVTPIQIIRMIASIFEGYLVKPRILQTEEVETTPLLISPQTLTFLRNGMRSAVTEGTGRRLSKLKDIEVYAKTGTAQISSLKLRSTNANYLEHAWFVAYFKIKQEQPLVTVILVENAGASSVATLTAKRFLLEYRSLLNAQQSNSH